LSVALAVFRTAQIKQPAAEHFLLLDEGMAHLDIDRQLWLWQELSDFSGNIVITGIQSDTPIPECAQHWSLH